MSFASWLRNWKASIERRSALNPTRRRRPPARRAARRLCLETLEDRTVLSPLLAVDNLAVSGSNGAVVSNTGTFSDTTAGATVTLTASAGTVVQSGNGTWSWSETTPLGAPQTDPVTIFATDNNGQTTATEFWLNVGQVFLVTTTDDNGGVYPAAGAGTGTLRQANADAYNAPTTGGPNLIAFAIPTTDPGYNGATGAFTIQPHSALSIPNSTVIDGYTQAGAVPNTLSQGDNAVLKIQLNLSCISPDDGAGLRFNRVNADNSTVRGLVVNGVTANVPAIVVGGTGNRIEGSFIGTDVSGTKVVGNAERGIELVLL